MPDNIAAEIERLRQERAELRCALLDALTVFEITADTRFRQHYRALIERAETKAE